MDKVEARMPSVDNVLLRTNHITHVMLRSLYNIVCRKVALHHTGTFSAAVQFDDDQLGSSIAFEGTMKVGTTPYRLALVLAPTSEDAANALIENDVIIANESYAVYLKVKNKAFIPRKDRFGSKRIEEFESSYASGYELINSGRDLSLAISKSVVAESLARLVKTNESNRKLDSS